MALIDGFNLYHAIDDCPHFHGYKWLNPSALARLYVHPKDEALVGVFFFTAVPPWDPKKRARHERLIAIYQDIGVIVVPGHFAPTSVLCRLCGKEYGTYEEKESDINLAVQLLRVGTDDIADRAIVVTGDNDQTASIRYFLATFKGKTVDVVLPPYRQAKELTSVATNYQALSGIHLKKAMLPNPYVFQKTKREDAYSPDHWQNGPPPPPSWRPRTQQMRHA